MSRRRNNPFQAPSTGHQNESFESGNYSLARVKSGLDLIYINTSTNLFGMLALQIGIIGSVVWGVMNQTGVSSGWMDIFRTINNLLVYGSLGVMALCPMLDAFGQFHFLAAPAESRSRKFAAFSIILTIIFPLAIGASFFGWFNKGFMTPSIWLVLGGAFMLASGYCLLKFIHQIAEYIGIGDFNGDRSSAFRAHTFYTLACTVAGAFCFWYFVVENSSFSHPLLDVAMLVGLLTVFFLRTNWLKKYLVLLDEMRLAIGERN